MGKETPTYSLEDFKDPTGLTKWVLWLSYFGIFASLCGLVAGYMEYEYYQSLKLDLYETEDLAKQAGALHDNLMALVASFQMFSILQIVAFFLWIYRLNYNTHALGIQMKFTPKWSVLWFFIPIANLWKGYQVLKDMWVTNQSEEASQSGGKVKAPFIGWFWLFMIWSTYLANKVTFYSFLANEDLDKLIRVNIFELASDLVEIPYNICTIILLGKFFKRHMVKFSVQAPEYEKRMAKLSHEEWESRKQSKWTQRTLLALLAICIVMAFIILVGIFLGDTQE